MLKKLLTTFFKTCPPRFSEDRQETWPEKVSVVIKLCNKSNALDLFLGCKEGKVRFQRSPRLVLGEAL